jgi:hypothetical protein
MAAASIHNPACARPVTTSRTGMSAAVSSTLVPASAGKRAWTTSISATARSAVAPGRNRTTAL